MFVWRKKARHLRVSVPNLEHLLQQVSQREQVGERSGGRGERRDKRADGDDAARGEREEGGGGGEEGGGGGAEVGIIIIIIIIIATNTIHTIHTIIRMNRMSNRTSEGLELGQILVDVLGQSLVDDSEALFTGPQVLGGDVGGGGIAGRVGEEGVSVGGVGRGGGEEEVGGGEGGEVGEDGGDGGGVERAVDRADCGRANCGLCWGAVCR